MLFGAKVAAKQLGALSRASGMHKVLVVRDRDVAAASRTRFVEFLLMQVGIPCFQYTLERDCATLDGVDHAAAMAQRVGADGIVGFGGGNAMDMARAVAVVLANDGSAVDFVVDTSEAKAQRGKLKTGPLVLVPTKRRGNGYTHYVAGRGRCDKVALCSSTAHCTRGRWTS